MKQSIFKQEWEVTGKASTVKGEIIVTMNYDTKTVVGTHAGTHDDYSRTNPVHKLESFIDGKIWWKKTDLNTEYSVLQEAEHCKKAMQEHMAMLSNDMTKTFVDKMTDLGFH